MRYKINFDKTINQLVPHYLGGRKLILFLQSISKPLQQLNAQFVDYAKETRIEASMTSQSIMFEWYLTRKFKQYFLDGGKIFIVSEMNYGVPIFYENAEAGSENMTLFKESEESPLCSALHYENEIFTKSSYSFSVVVPIIDERKITKSAFESMLSFYIDKYRIANKTYKIVYNERI